MAQRFPVERERETAYCFRKVNTNTICSNAQTFEASRESGRGASKKPEAKTYLPGIGPKLKRENEEGVCFRRIGVSVFSMSANPKDAFRNGFSRWERAFLMRAEQKRQEAVNSNYFSRELLAENHRTSRTKKAFLRMRALDSQPRKKRVRQLFAKTNTLLYRWYVYAKLAHNEPCALNAHNKAYLAGRSDD